MYICIFNVNIYVYLFAYICIYVYVNSCVLLCIYFYLYLDFNENGFKTSRDCTQSIDDEEHTVAINPNPTNFFDFRSFMRTTMKQVMFVLMMVKMTNVVINIQ
jgi:hypothetical protein